MKIRLRGQDYNLEPFGFNHNEIISNGYFGYDYTSYQNEGDYLDLTAIYYDIWLEHRGDNTSWTGTSEIFAHVKYEAAGGANVDIDLTVTPSFNPTEPDYLLLLFYNSFTSTGAAVPIKYRGAGDDSLYNKICMFYVDADNTSIYGSAIGLCHPSKEYPATLSMYRGGFTHREYNTQTQIVDEFIYSFEMLGQYPTPDPNIPLSYVPRADDITNFCICTPAKDKEVEWNGEKFKPATPDEDINTPDTSSGPYHDISDTIDLDSLPTTGPLDTGFIKAYVLTLSQCQSIATFMLTDNFLNNVKKLFATPIDYIISLHFLPVSPSTTTASNVLIGGVDTEVSAPRTYDNYLDFSCGAIKLDEFWGSFIDYDCTKVAIYLPFIGIRDLNTDDVMTGTLKVNYRVNVLDGDFVVTVHSNTTHKLNGIIAEYQGNMLLSTPVTAQDYSNKFSSAFTALSSLPGIAAGNAGSMVQGAAGMLEATLSKPMIQRSGNISGGAGMLGYFTPYLIKTRPKQAVPSLFTKLFGKPSMIGGSLNDFSGYTKIAKINLSGVACTDAERDEILQLLEEGVFV